MVELLKDFPPHVAAYRASGAVSKEEYERVVMTRVDEVAIESVPRPDYLLLIIDKSKSSIHNKALGISEGFVM